MSKSKYRFGGNVRDTVPASRQNIEQRTPSGVRPVASPVTPMGTVLGRSNGGELKMNKPKKMAFGGPAGRMVPGGSKPGAPVNQRVPGVMPQYGGPAPNMAPGAGRMPMAGGFGGSAGPGGFAMDGRANQFAPGAMPQYGGRVPGMKKGGMASASSYEDMTGGAAGGIGRLEKSSIAAKTVSQKLKKGGKVSGYADGKMVTADDDGTFNKAFANARSAKADEFMWRGKKYTTKIASGKKGDEPTYASQRAAQPGPDVDVYGDAARNRGKGGGRSGPTSGGEAQMREMGLYPFGTDSNNVDTVRDEKYAKDNRGKGGGRSGTARASANARADASAKTMERGIRKTEGNMAERDAAYNSMKDDAFRAMLKGKQRTSAIGGGMSEERVYPMTSEEMRNAAREMNATVGGMRRGGMTKMAKGGKAEKFEGSFMDMVQDKKLAKKHGMSKKAYEKSPIDAKHDKQKSMKGLKMGGMSKMAAGGMSTAQDGMKGAMRPKPTAMAMGGYAKGGKAEMHDKGCKCMACGGKVKMAMGGYAKGGKAEAHMKGCKCMACGGMAKKMAKGGVVGMTFGKPLPGTKVSSQKIRATTATGASLKKDGMKGQLRAKASGAKPTNMMKPLGMTKMAAGGKVRGTGIAQRGTKFIGEV